MIISCYRDGAYANTATRGAPHVQKVVYRYNVLHNLRYASKGNLARKPGSWPEVTAERGEPCSSFHPTMTSLEALRKLDAQAPEGERASAPQDQRLAVGTPAEMRR
jgi:hypothetical protein